MVSFSYTEKDLKVTKFATDFMKPVHFLKKSSAKRFSLKIHEKYLKRTNFKFLKQGLFWHVL